MARLLIVSPPLLVAALPTPAAHAVEPDGALIRLTTNNYTYRIVGGAPVRISRCRRSNNCEGRKDVAEPHRIPRVSEGRRDRAQPRRRPGRTASPAARRCGSPPAATRRRARAASTSTTLADTAHIRADAGRRHDHPQRQRRRLLPLRGRRAAARALRHGRRLPGADDGRRADDGQVRAPTPRRRTCASTRRTAPSSTTATTTSTSASPAARRCRSPRPPAGAKQIIDSRTLVQQGTATAALPHIRPYPADNTFLTAAGAYWRVAGGAAVVITTAPCSATARRAVTVDAGTISWCSGGPASSCSCPMIGMYFFRHP